MTALTRLATDRQEALVTTSARASRAVLRVWNRTRGADMDAAWDSVAPELDRIVYKSQLTAARQSQPYVNAAAGLQDASVSAPRVIPDAFAGVTREGRAVVPELYAGVTTAKTLIGRGVGVGEAFRAGAAYMAVIAATMVRDAGRMADRTAAVSKGSLFSVRVLHAGACSRCAILAGIKGYKVDFDRHPGCRCTAMPLFDTDAAPDGFFRDPGDYFESLSADEQARVFTKAGAEAIRLGADPVKVVNARRGMYRTSVGRVQVLATSDGTTARGMWGRAQNLDVRRAGDRYRRTSTLRLMPESIIKDSRSPERARELLQRYGYLY